MFRKWRNREEGENRTHSGRVHHFVALSRDGRRRVDVDGLNRQPKSLPKDALWLSAGWASLIPTKACPIARHVVGGRFYDGALGEVQYIRRARVLKRHKGR